MVVPYAIGGVVFSAIVALALFTEIDLGTYLREFTKRMQFEVNGADLEMTAGRYGMLTAVGGLLVWFVVIGTTNLPPSIALVALALAESLAVLSGIANLRVRSYLRLRDMQDQLEQVFRMVSGALRAGVGLRQALIMVADELPDPARREFRRVIGRCNIGIPMVDAIDEMTKTIPGNEIQMFARVIRVQQQTGGDLAMILEQLAATIRDRRRMKRKIGALTAQGRFGAALIGALPILVGGFVISTQVDMADALFHTRPGQGMLGAIFVLEAVGIVTLLKIVALDV